MTAPRLLDQVRAAIRARHYSRRTEEAYVYWIRRFIVFHGKRHPRELGSVEVSAFVTWLQASVRLATFSFCSPFRTPAWSSLPAVVKSAVANASQAILLKIVRDCRPRLIIITGVDGFRLFTEIMGATLGVNRVISKGGEAGAHQWAAYDATVGDDRIVIAQVPHFSRAGVTAKLRQCAEWLAGVEETTESAPS